MGSPRRCVIPAAAALRMPPQVATVAPLYETLLLVLERLALQ